MKTIQWKLLLGMPLLSICFSQSPASLLLKWKHSTHSLFFANPSMPQTFNLRPFSLDYPILVAPCRLIPDSKTSIHQYHPPTKLSFSKTLLFSQRSHDAITVSEKIEVLSYRLCLLVCGFALILNVASISLLSELGDLGPQEILLKASFNGSILSSLSLGLGSLFCRVEKSRSMNIFLKLGALLSSFHLFSQFNIEFDFPQVFQDFISNPNFLTWALVPICIREIVWFGLEFKIDALICILCSISIVSTPYLGIENADTMILFLNWVLSLSVSLLGAGKLFEPIGEDLKIGKSNFLKEMPLEQFTDEEDGGL